MAGNNRSCAHCGHNFDVGPFCGCVRPLPDAAFEAKVTGILARGFVDALRLQREHEEHASGPPANVDDRDATTGLPIAAVGDVRDHSDAEAAACVVGYNRALADSLKSAEQILDKLAEEHWPLVALVAHIKERLAEDSGRLGWSFSGDDLLREVGRVGAGLDVVLRDEE